MSQGHKIQITSDGCHLTNSHDNALIRGSTLSARNSTGIVSRSLNQGINFNVSSLIGNPGYINSGGMITQSLNATLNHTPRKSNLFESGGIYNLLSNKGLNHQSSSTLATSTLTSPTRQFNKQPRQPIQISSVSGSHNQFMSNSHNQFKTNGQSHFVKNPSSSQINFPSSSSHINLCNNLFATNVNTPRSHNQSSSNLNLSISNQYNSNLDTEKRRLEQNVKNHPRFISSNFKESNVKGGNYSSSLMNAHSQNISFGNSNINN